MLAGRSGVSPLTQEWAEQLPVRIAAQLAVDPTEVLDRVKLRRLDRSEAIALIAAHEAWADAGLADAGLDPERLAVSVGTGIGGAHDPARPGRHPGGQRARAGSRPHTVPMLMPNGPAAWVGLELGAQAGVHSPASACATGAEAIALGLDIIRSGRADVVVAGGTEAVIHPLPIAGFASMRAMSTRNDEPEKASRPWDKGRDGFVLGEGAGVARAGAGRPRRAPAAPRVYARLAGAGITSDGYDIVAAAPARAPGAVRAIAQALARRRRRPRPTSCTSTRTPPRRRSATWPRSPALHAALGDHPVLTATKSMTGHLLGAAGALESIATILAIRDGVVPPTINLDDPDDGLDLDVAAHKARHAGHPRRAEQLVRLRRPQRRAGLHPRLTHAPRRDAVTTTSVAADQSTVDYRDPEVRLRALFDAGTLRLLAPARRLRRAGRPRRDRRHPGDRVRHRRHPDGRRDGHRGLPAHRRRDRHRGPRAGAGGRPLALRRRPAGRGRGRAGRGRPGLRRDGARLRPGAADLGGARPGGRRRRVRPGADRHRDHERRRPDLRDRPRGGPQRHRRAGRHGAPRRPRAARPPLRRRARDHQGRRVGAGRRPASSPRCSAARAGSPGRRRRRRRRPRPGRARCRPRPTGRTTSSRWSRRCSTSPGVELHAKWAPNVVTTLGRFAGRTVGVIANNPLRLGGCLDASSAEKAARFVRMCDALGVPLIVLVDVPGYLPGLGQEWDGVVRRGAKLLHAFAEAVVPRVTLVTRKAYGGAYIAMNSRSLGATAVFAWPNAEVAVMGASAAVNILHRKKLAAAPPEEREALRAQLIEEQIQVAGGVQPGAGDRRGRRRSIEPAETRRAHRRGAGRRAPPPAAPTATSRSDPTRAGRRGRRGWPGAPRQATQARAGQAGSTATGDRPGAFALPASTAASAVMDSLAGRVRGDQRRRPAPAAARTACPSPR